MYKVVIRKSLRYADGSSALEESQEEVNHERHALNLAVRIARSDAVESVEIEELGGQFKAQANRVSRGKVQATLQSPRRRVQRETYFHSGLTNRFPVSFSTSIGFEQPDTTLQVCVAQLMIVFPMTLHLLNMLRITAAEVVVRGCPTRCLPGRTTCSLPD